MPRALVTGGAGFLGSHLCDRLLAEGFDVVAMDNLITGSADNIAHLSDDPRFRFLHQDVTEPLTLDGALDFVFHLASPASPVDFLTKPIEILTVNSVGTHRGLELARTKGAIFFLASTSEVYGDPLVHPQVEEYLGNVNPIGVRGVYDESKRFGESITMAYHRLHGLDTKIVRIFNSILADETVAVFDGDEMHLTPIEAYAEALKHEVVQRPHRLRVPAFDPATGRMTLREANALLQHPPQREDAFLVKTRYGREIRVTGDHSIFRMGKDGRPEAVPVRELRVGDHVAIAGRLPVVEKDRAALNLAEAWIKAAPTPDALWDVALVSPALADIIVEHADAIATILTASGRFKGSAKPRNSIGCALRKYRKSGLLPLTVFDRLRHQVRLDWPEDARLRLYQGGAWLTLPNAIALTDDLLWFLGLFLAEGTIASYLDKGTHFVTLCSHQSALDRAKRIMEESFGLKVGVTAARGHRGPTVYSHSRLLCWLMSEVLGMRGLSHEKRIPAWVFQLPLSRFKHFLDGYREGDGTHSGANVGRKLNFVTVSRNLAQDLLYALLRFGIVASLGRYESRLGKDGTRRYPFYSITVCNLSSHDILTWDRGVTQRINARVFGDLVWAQVNAVEPIQTTRMVYDFSVPEVENFIAGTGVMAKNTYGPRMRLNDGRVVPNFIGQALRGERLTVYGDGRQTRSFCYCADLIDGFYRLAMSDQTGPINIGNPTERTMLEFAQEIKALTNSRSEIVFQPLPTADDPKQRRPDITKARMLLGWEPKVSLEDGLRQTIAYFQSRLSRE
jgi:nucleoside-diphosphate-sugar epimerase/intein/homing endonuclease